MNNDQLAPATGYTFGYRRVSSVQQDYARQTAALAEAGIPWERIFEDKLSGKTMDRPGFREMLDRLRPGDTVVVSSLDRFGRTTTGILNAIDELTERGVSIKSLKPGEDFRGITGRLILTVMAAIAEWERANTAERAAEARAARKARGIEATRTKTALTPERVDTVRRLRSTGATIAAIVRTTGISRASVYRALDA
jgi:DNA invertase Pin-like site-specific DNA recombinase